MRAAVRQTTGEREGKTENNRSSWTESAGHPAEFESRPRMLSLSSSMANTQNLKIQKTEGPPQLDTLLQRAFPGASGKLRTATAAIERTAAETGQAATIDWFQKAQGREHFRNLGPLRIEALRDAMKSIGYPLSGPISSYRRRQSRTSELQAAGPTGVGATEVRLDTPLSKAFPAAGGALFGAINALPSKWETTIGGLLGCKNQELLAMRNMGPKRLEALRRAMHSIGRPMAGTESANDRAKPLDVTLDTPLHTAFPAADGQLLQAIFALKRSGGPTTIGGLLGCKNQELLAMRNMGPERLEALRSAMEFVGYPMAGDDSRRRDSEMEASDTSGVETAPSETTAVPDPLSDEIQRLFDAGDVPGIRALI